MAVTVYSQQSVPVSLGGGAVQTIPVHLTFDSAGPTLNIYVNGDSPIAGNLASAMAQSGNNVSLTLPSSSPALIEAAAFAAVVDKLVQKIYMTGVKSFPTDRTVGLLLARLGLVSAAAAIANL